MKNVGDFYALAHAQLDRATGTETRDAVLRAILPATLHPTDPSRAQLIGTTAIGHERRLLYFAAVRWLSEPNAEERITTFYSNPSDMELRGQLIRHGAVTADADAPCRTYPWRPIADAIERLKVRTTARVYATLVEWLGESRARAFVRDSRYLLTEPEDGLFLPLTEAAVKGLAWVAGDEGSTDWSPSSAMAVVRDILAVEDRYWPDRRTVSAWTPDTVAAWAEACHHYIEESRRVR